MMNTFLKIKGPCKMVNLDLVGSGHCFKEAHMQLVMKHARIHVGRQQMA